MTIEAIVQELDSEIAKLTKARLILTHTPYATRKTKGKTSTPIALIQKPGRGNGLSAAGRAAISAAAKRRWANQRKAAKSAA